MNVADRALDEFFALLRPLAGLSEREKIVGLKSELLEALERAHGLERELERLEGAADLGDAFDNVSLARSWLRLEERVLASAPPRATHPLGHGAALKELRLELLEMGWQCEALEAFCRLLMRRTKAHGPPAASFSTHSQATP